MWLFGLVSVFVIECLSPIVYAQQPRIKKYYLQAELVEWNYLPEQRDACHGSDKWQYDYNKGNKQGRFTKAIYQLYEDAQFTRKVEIAQEYLHTGLIGAIMYAEGGDMLEVVFRNTLPFSVKLPKLSAVWLNQYWYAGATGKLE
eukprot:TRINITY_DN3590_c0_g1_i7.p2 TRINITY_DN3590_c0_g1~~TRINITY_DN3590_c0_g1_i7.p2  ORF type:complete len:144 (-),score=15.29 TRINITY_DN3590_c0_g1_i7:9-440(-)